jgi:predicted TIM-barrel fold metal-dependent hydrolase
MIVDCHTHIQCPLKQVGRTEHRAATEALEGCIVLGMPVSDEGSSKVNKELSEYVSGHKEKMVGFAVVDPLRDKIGHKSIKALQEDLNLKGCVLYCCECGFHPTHSRAMRFYESAEELGLSVFFHNASPLAPNAILDYAQPSLLDEVARTFGSLKMVIGQMGRPFIEQALCMVEKHQNVYADLTIQPENLWQTYNTVVAAHEQGVMDKLLFGSGFPFAQPGACIERLLGLNKLLSDTNLPTIPQGQIRGVVERDSLTVLGIKR